MQTPEYVGSSAARMIVALAAFLGLVTAGVWIASRTDSEPRQDHAAQEVAATPATSTQFFYKSIGKAAEGTDAKDQKAGPALKVSYTLELKVATTRDEAERLIDELAQRGVEAYYTPLSRQGHVVYRVRRGIFPSQKTAAKAALALKDQHQVKARIVKLQ